MAQETITWERGEIPQPAQSCSLHRFTFPRALSLAGLDIVGDGECVALIQHYMLGVNHSTTFQFEEKSLTDIFKDQFKPGFDRRDYPEHGTVIGNKTKDGKWPGKAHGNHLCFFWSYNGAWNDETKQVTGFLVVEQFVGLRQIQVRRIMSKGKDSNGEFPDPSNNADAFFCLKRIMK